jgi:hypothetical protein
VFNVPKPFASAWRSDEDGAQDLTYTATISSYVNTRKDEYYSCQFGSMEVAADPNYNIEDEPEECVEFDGELITRDEFGVICGWDKCYKCHKPFQFIDGHRYVRGSNTDIVCACCVEEIEEANEVMKLNLRKLADSRNNENQC